jgi:hypothetical protein
MSLTFRLSALAALALCAAAAVAQESKLAPATEDNKGVQELNAEELERLFRGNSFSGYHFGSGRTFTEYHHPDGRVIGHNGVNINTDGCWYVREGAICYVYGPPKDRRTYCFVMHRTGNSRNMTLTALPERRLIGIGVLEEGNARNHVAPNDWTCEANISSRPAEPLSRFAERLRKPTP